MVIQTDFSMMLDVSSLPSGTYILLIDDLEALSDENMKTLNLASTSANIIPTVAGARRWFRYDRRFNTFDPLHDQTRYYATGVSLKAYAKMESLGFDYSDLSERKSIVPTP